ncbi:MAG: hypothetical protein A3A58_00255 [Candidatus Blackburnbacteria bacterium RIFCSPLOWO2_01_FULL_41_27]|uniref:UDP-glucose/GDP-mannose dehydrogenase C-terminal domain-containing protein n=2 Tax=Candidatus Blackburniibacteriota TaxID=1817898 RepID=A0A1G1VCN4_9BACT|nr:MAG: hypothetical protein A3A58_00255 [Candidatus Blackburnbacteria bacterium RIFCSPLOWO2_01_FULL_41_27]OGY12982.1 MAG: hypothetical protein A3F61_00640 [Candidatus Blackburnbacteria bacterium RIFCSPHIGHO2_12_FULL_41_13b]
MPSKNKVTVVGIGRVGLPLALVLADKGYEVIGADVDKARLNLISKGKLPFIEEGAEPLLKKYYGNRFTAVEKLGSSLEKSEIIIITLGTPIDGNYTPNFSQIIDFFEEACPYLKKGQLIILRSTIAPGVTENIKRIIEEKTKFKVGEDIFLAYCPERIAEGKAVQELAEIPQIIGTLDKNSAKEAGEVFKKITKTIHFTDTLSAELAKLYCNIYRYIDFAIGNEFMMIAEGQGADIYEVLRLVNEGYKRGGLKSPGFTAGPCLVKDSFFLLDKSPYLDLMVGAWRINENVPGFLVNTLKEKYGSFAGKKVAILGLAFKKNIDDIRYSLTPKLQNYFIGEGASVLVHDPLLPSESLEVTLKDADLVIVATNHDIFKNMGLEKIRQLSKESCVICDVWNMWGVGKIIFRLDEVEK